MKIFYYWSEDDSNMSLWQRIHIFDELERNGHEIQVFNLLNYENLDSAYENLIKKLKDNNNRPDLFMTCLGSDKICIQSIQYIKSLGIPTLLICFDNLHAPYMHKKIAPLFDLVWLTSFETERMFKLWGCNTIFMPYASNPNIFKMMHKQEINAVGFIGTPYGSRTNKINHLTQNEIICNVYFSPCQHNKIKILNYDNIIRTIYDLARFDIGRRIIFGAVKNKLLSRSNNKLIINDYLNLLPSVSFQEMNNLYSNLSISLGITELRNTYVLNNPIHKLHLRTFEIPMSGGLQLASYTSELESYFEDQKEIILYKSDEEMISKARFYLKPENQYLRNKIKLAARERAENEHTWICRFNKVFEIIK